LHRIRIASKQLRYAAELSTPVIGKGAHRTAKAGKRLQTLLGDHHDAVSAERWLRTEGLRADPEVSFAAGQLAATLHRHQQSLGGRWRGLWDPLKAKKRHRWLH
jgi:CHAD domain-containing protein